MPHSLKLDAGILAQHQAAFPLPPACKGIFTREMRVQDVWRYTLKVGQDSAVTAMIPHKAGSVGGSEFADRPAADVLSEQPRTPVLLLLLESPHVHEYRWVAGKLRPVAPAQGTSPGDAGGAILRYLPLVVGKLKLPAGSYRVVIANPVQYQCSLGHWYGKLYPPIRDHVWEQIWSLEFIQREFAERLATCQPAAVLNCCTDALKDGVSELVLAHSHVLYEAPHPAVQWNVFQENIPVQRRAKSLSRQVVGAPNKSQV
ncbi:hypothetical protein [Myxococcus faecalis]|uniref:hypothetical protein n=1 Tax=Myxococcus faecalis TaxID=3115646 RepID=UPI003CF0982A